MRRIGAAVEHFDHKEADTETRDVLNDNKTIDQSLQDIGSQVHQGVKVTR